MQWYGDMPRGEKCFSGSFGIVPGIETERYPIDLAGLGCAQVLRGGIDVGGHKRAVSMRANRIKKGQHHWMSPEARQAGDFAVLVGQRKGRCRHTAEIGSLQRRG